MAFLKNSKVLLDNYKYIDIDHLFRSMKVIGAKGETNTVLGRARRLLNHQTRNFIRINDKLTVTTETPLVGPEGLYVGSTTHFTICNTPVDTRDDAEPWLISEFIEVFLPDLSVEDGRGKWIYYNNERWLMKPFPTRLISPLKFGTVLYGENLELITVNKIEDVNVDPNELVFTPITDGSTSYIVDGFAVCGWLRNDCFDYTTWTKITDIDYNHVPLSMDSNGTITIVDDKFETRRLY